MTRTSDILITRATDGYALLDSGDGRKLERFGKFILSRPDPQALWHTSLPSSEWQKADGAFVKDWSLNKGVPERWQASIGGFKFWIRPSSFKHTGIFPEQSANWEWLRGKIGNQGKGNPAAEILNLFGYTGAATLACAQAGGKVVHVDGSKAAIAWARENAELSGLKDKPVRWILDDARVFVKREIKRERRYDGIIMDPPAFGHGPDNQLWKIEEDLLPLVDDCMKLLTDKPLFFLINGYSAGYSAVAYENALLPLRKKFGGRIEMGELAIEENKSAADASTASARLLPAGIFARWSR